MDTPSADELVAEVRIDGNRTYPSSQVFGQLTTRAGRPFDEQVVLQDVQKLLRLGWFAYVQPFYEQTPQGKIVVFRVTERPTIRWVEYLDNHSIKTRHLTDKTGLKYGETLDPYRVQEGARKLEEFYQSKGFNRVQVQVVEGLKPGDKGVAYEIHEGPKQRIAHVKFEGNNSDFVSDFRLKVLIQSKPAILRLFRGEIDERKIEADRLKIEQYYREFGYFQAKVQDWVEFNDDGTWATLRFIIHEGPRFRVRNISINGNQQFATQHLLERMQLKPGEPYEDAELNADRTWLSDLYGSRGYVFADIKPNIVFLDQPGEIDLQYDIAEGERWRVGRIFVHIGGENPHTKTTVALNHLSLSPGDIVDTGEIKASERRLIASNLFLRDPARGVSPKITYKIPELDGQNPRALARGGDTYRGQSPDAPKASPSQSPPHATYRPLASDRPRGDVEMHLQFQDQRHYEQWLQSPPTDAAAAAPAAAGTGAPVPRQPIHEAYRNLLAPPAPQAPPREQQRHSSPPADATRYRNPRSVPPEPELIYRGQNASGGYGGLGMGSTGPDGGRASSFAAPRMAQGSPAFDPNRPLSPNSPGTLATPADLGPMYGLQPVTPFGYSGEPMVDVYIDVDETQTGRFMAGVGINSDAGVVGSIVIDERNFDIWRFPYGWADIGNAFRGGGQHFRMEAAPGSEVQRYLISWQDPYWRDTPFSLGLAGSYYDRRYRDWDEQRLGGRVSLGYLWPRRDIEATIAYRGENINIHDAISPRPQELEEVIGDNVLHGFRVSIANDTRDSAFLATMGHYVEMSFEQVVGSFDYPRAMLDMRKYFLVRHRPDQSGRHVLSYSTRLGFTGSQTPIYEHFFAGGYSTLRGFDFRGASPVASGVEVGGEFMWINSLEYLMPLTADDMLHLVGFVDFGTVEQDVEIRDFRIAPGLGARITVPAMGPAPIALDFAWPISSADTDDLEVFSFSVGLQR